MTTLELLSTLRSRDIEIWADGDRLRYNAPKASLTPDLRKELVAHKSEILALLRQADTVSSATSCPLKPVSRTGDLPLSSAQLRLWFLHHLEPDSVAYSMPRRIRLKGLLRKSALEKAFIELARRHETLRTTFDAIDGNPMLRIATEPNIQFDTINLRHLPDEEREAEAQRLSAEDARKPFDLSRGPLLRIQLVQLEDEVHVLHFNMHHIISDHWSFGVMAREIAELYTAFIKGKPANLPDLPVQYADYAIWQRQWLQGEALAAQLNYWKAKLGDELPVLELPTDRPRPAVRSRRGAIESLALSKELTDALQAMSRRAGVTLFMTLLTAFKTLLYRHTGQEDILVGTPIANRNRVEIEGLIGFFMNTIVMRTDLTGQPTFRELLGRVKEMALSAYAHQDMPFEKLVEELAPERDLSRTPLFQVFFNHLVNTGEQFGDLPGIETEVVGGLERESKFDMTLFVFEGNDGIELHLIYNTDLFDDWRMAGLLKQYRMLLASIVSDVDQRISALSILTEPERHQILLDWNDTQQGYASEKTFVHLFEEQVERSPDAVAVAYEDQNLTYDELNKRANQIAHHLYSLGVGPEMVVGICVERSFEMVFGLLGILKAGGSYLPLDPEYPQERLQYMVQDAGADLILTSRRLTDFVKALGDLSLVTLDDNIYPEGFDDTDKVPTNVVHPGNLAYVIYTSGSTGLPKGTLIEHKSLVNYLCWINTNLMVDGGVRLPLITKLTFDASLKQLFAPLLRGDAVLIFPDDVVAQPVRLLKALAKHHQVGLNCTPSLWKVIIDEISNNPDRRPMDNLSHLFIGGERLSADLVNRSLATLPHLHIWNLYGPSEVTANASAARIVSQVDVTIGRPIANTQIYILDPYLQLTPIGVPGELHVGGEALARGYLNRPDLIAERFIPNPFSDQPGERLYKTGDLVRYLPDGNIEFLGRLDNQVKIRGFRIELGEVEATLCLHPSVSEAVVVAREERPGDKRLVAYLVTAEAESAPFTGVLRAYLQRKLPDYMIPSVFVPIDAIPMTANGKVDLRALPAPDLERSRLVTIAEALVAPRDALELQLTKLWEKVLGVKNIGIQDNFFDLGGHSLLAVRLFAQIRKIFAKDLPLTTLFQAPTIQQLASIIRQEGLSSPWSSLVAIQPGGARPPFFCIHGCNGRVLHFYDLAGHLGPDQPFYGLTAQGREDDQDLHGQFEEMAAHYIKEIRTVQFEGPYFLGASGAGCFIALEMAHQLEAQGQDVALMVYLVPSPVQPNLSPIKFSIARSMWQFYNRIFIFMQTRPFMPTIRFTFANRILYRWKILHRFVPIEIHRRRRFLKKFSEALSSYTPEAYHGRITCILQDKFARNPKKGLGEWPSLSVGGLDVRFIPGNILSMWREPHVKTLAAQLRSCLDEAQTKN